MPSVTVLDHPLLRHKLALLRDKTTTTAMFR
jgi:uracil phosphoribosyltransferase